MNKEILRDEVQAFINEHLYQDVSTILFKKSPFPNVSVQELAEQIESKRSSEKKLPTWFNTPNIYFPKKLSIEQTSSEITAKRKAQLIEGETLIDLTGGFGVDAFYFSRIVKSIVHCEINVSLSEIANYNAAVLGAKNISFFNGDGITNLRNVDQSYDTIYLDPARRKNARKVFLLSDCEPNVVEELDLLFSRTKRIIIKTSPLLDIQSGISELRNVRRILVVSVKNDCKELLWILDKDYEGEPEIECVAISEEKTQEFKFKISEEREVNIAHFALPGQYLYDPDVSILKAGAFKLIAQKLRVEKLSPNSHLYTSKDLIPNFPGRTFKIERYSTYKEFSKNKTIQKANIISKNFPLSPEEIKKKNKLQDGGDDYLIFTLGPKGELLAIQAKKQKEL